MSRANSSSNSEKMNGHQEEPAREVVEDPDYQLILDAEPSPNTTLDENDHIFEPEKEEPMSVKEPEAEPIAELVEQVPEPEPHDIEPKDQEGEEKAQAQQEEEKEPDGEIESTALPIVTPDESEYIKENTTEQNSQIYQDEIAQLETSQDIPESNATQDDNDEEEEEVELPEVPAEVQDDIDKFEELANLVDKSAAELTSNAGSISGKFFL